MLCGPPARTGGGVVIEAFGCGLVVLGAGVVDVVGGIVGTVDWAGLGDVPQGVPVAARSWHRCASARSWSTLP
jgi:hypothetical protein